MIALALAPLGVLQNSQFLRPVAKMRIDRSDNNPMFWIIIRSRRQTRSYHEEELLVFGFSGRGQSFRYHL